MQKNKFGFRLCFKQVFWLLCVVALAFAFIVAVVPNNDAAPISNEITHPFNQGWFLENENRFITLPSVVPAKAGSNVVITHVLPESIAYTPSSLSFITTEQSVRVEVAGAVIYEYGYKPNAYLELAPPPAWHIIRLKHDMAGQNIRITYSSPMQHYAGVLNSIDLGSKYANASSLFGNRLLSIALSFTIFVFGVFSIIVWLFTRSKLAELNKLLYLGTASILIALWSACETKVMQVLVGNVYLILFVTFLSIMLIPIALLLFFRESFCGRIRRMYNAMLAVFCAYFVVVVALQVLNLVPINIPFSLFLCLTGIMLLLILITVLYAYFKSKTLQTQLPVIAVLFLVAFSMVDMVRFFNGLSITGYSDTTVFVRVGVLAMLFTLGYSSIRQLLAFYTESTKAQVYKALSETDALSGLKNRVYLTNVYHTLFEEAVLQKNWFSVIMIDIDNFKSYNDHYGHGAGDEVIRKVSEVFGAAGNNSLSGAVRYGGEEFLVLLPMAGPGEAMVTAESIRTSITALKIPHEYSAVSSVLTVSQGIHSGIPRECDTLDAFIECADEALYRAKREGKNVCAASGA